MPVTAEDVEKELQDEFARKAKAKKPSEALDGSIPRRCRILLGVGTTFVGFVVLFPRSGHMLGNTDDEEISDVRRSIETSPHRFVHSQQQQSSLWSSTNREGVESAAGKSLQNDLVVGQEPIVKKPPSGDSQMPLLMSQPHAAFSAIGSYDVLWTIVTTCIKQKSVTCTSACNDQGLQCDVKSLKTAGSELSMKKAVEAAGAACAKMTKVDMVGPWDGPLLKSGECTYNPNPKWQPICGAAPACGLFRVCACKREGEMQGNGPQRFRTAMQAPVMWWDVASRVPKAIPGDWGSETLFLDRLLRQFGKLTPGYKGSQRLLGFQYGKIFDDQGMFAFENSVRSVAIDVGAATNPVSFDINVDNSQVAIFVEPLQWKTIEESIEKSFSALGKGGCAMHYDVGICPLERTLVFPAAISSELGHATFHVTQNPYCGSLEAFTGADQIRKSKFEDVRGIFDQCYKDASKPRQVATLSLKAIIERIPKHVAIKYVKIDAQGHDFKVLLSAADQMSRIEYARFEMQVDPPEGHKLVKDIPSYEEVKKQMEEFGFKHNGAHACYFDGGASRFSRIVKEMECVFCRKLPCIENGRAPMGPNPGSKSILKASAHRPYIQPAPWQIPASMASQEYSGTNR